MTRAWSERRRGTTLLELLVVLAILGIALAVAGVSMNAPARAVAAAPRALVADARRQAIESGRPVRLALHDSAGVRVVRAAPDGGVLGAAPLGIEWSSGRPVHDAP
jgi:prepilin-type N-terminal cleavage/methylation domain-containing protein